MIQQTYTTFLKNYKNFTQNDYSWENVGTHFTEGRTRKEIIERVARGFAEEENNVKIVIHR